MLEPHSRCLLLESLRPPDEYRLDWAVGTTYTLDLMALLSAPVAFAFSDWQDCEGRPVADPLALLKAVRQYASRICLFCQGGKIHVPAAYQPLLASLEDSIVEARAPLGGSFHPKMWFLRFVADDETVVYRVLCLSRNMTFDRSWDTLLSLEGTLRERTNAYGKNHPLGAFVESLTKMSIRSIVPSWRKRLDRLAYEVRRVEFEIPEPFEEIDFWPLGIAKNEPWPFPRRIDELLVVSPFVEDGLAEDLTDWQAPMQLLSRAESLARLQPSTLGHVKNVWVLDDTAEPEPGEAEELGEEDDESQAPTTPTDMPLVGLHAKLYVVDQGWNARVFTGSANATRAAFNRNVEFLVELRGKRSRCGVAATLGQSNDDGKKHVSCLADLLQPYVRCDGDEGVDEDVIRFERFVDQLAKALAATAPVAVCAPCTDPDSYSLTVISKRAVKGGHGSGWELRARPISLQSSQLQIVDYSKSPWVSFEPISLLGLTSFFAFEVTSEDQKLRRQFVLNIPLENAPANRQERILRDMLSDRDRVLRFLLLLLLDSGARDFHKVIEGENGGDGPITFVHSMFGSTLFESLVRALDREPERLDQVAQVISDLRGTAEGNELLPNGLEEIWKPIWSVRQKQIEREKTKRKRESR